MVLAGAAIAVMRWALRQRPPPAAATATMITAAKAALADLVQGQWREEARIRSLGDPQLIPVAWHLTGKRALMDHPHLIAARELAFAGSADDIRALAGQFRALRSRRLIITGGPGTGKTTLAVQLLLELLASRGSEEPVPVMLSIAGWDTARTSGWRHSSPSTTRRCAPSSTAATPPPGRSPSRGTSCPSSMAWTNYPPRPEHRSSGR